MKIRRPNNSDISKIYALLGQAFYKTNYEKDLVEKLHKNNKIVHQWVCIQRNRVIAYIGFTNAYKGKDVLGLHLEPLAVKPDFQNQGVGSELLNFALRQKEIKENPVFVVGDPDFYEKFNFKVCKSILSPFDKKYKNFLSIGIKEEEGFTIGYEPEFFKVK